MRFYYSGASDFLDPQTEPVLSLGSYISSSLVPNGKENNVIPNLSEYTIDLNKAHTNLIVLKNESGATITNLKMWVNYSIVAPSCEIQLALVTPSQKAFINKTKYFFESIPNTESLPYLGNFIAGPVGEANGIIIAPTFADQAYLGFWIKRIIKTENIRNITNACTIDPGLAASLENFTINLDWV